MSARHAVILTADARGVPVTLLLQGDIGTQPASLRLTPLGGGRFLLELDAPGVSLFPDALPLISVSADG
jgi:hypothetical protein